MKNTFNEELLLLLPLADAAPKDPRENDDEPELESTLFDDSDEGFEDEDEFDDEIWTDESFEDEED